MHLNLETQVGEGQSRAVNSVFQVADLTRPLMSVSQICDHGYKCVFERDHAMDVTPEGEALCRFEWQPGLYVSKMILKSPTPFFVGRSHSPEVSSTRYARKPRS